MGMDLVALKASKKYTEETVLGGGAVVGKNVTISSIEPIDGGNRVTFSYTLDNGTIKTSTMDVMNGKTPVKGVDYIDGENGKTPVKGVDYFDGENGQPGFSPTITENADNTDKIYKLDIETANGTFTTPNLKGSDGENGTGSGGISYNDMKQYVDNQIGGVLNGSY